MVGPFAYPTGDRQMTDMADMALARIKEAQTVCTQMGGPYSARLEVVDDGIRAVVIHLGGSINWYNTHICSWLEIEQARLNPITNAIQRAVSELKKGGGPS